MTTTLLIYPGNVQTFEASDWPVQDFCTTDIGPASNPLDDPAVRTGVITDLGEPGYQLLRSIPFVIKRDNISDYSATFSEGNIGTGGISWHDAYQALIAAILDTFDALHGEANLSQDAAAQFQTLQTYLVKTGHE